MTRHRRPPAVRALAALVAACLLGAVALALPGAARAAVTKVVRYHGWHATVPASWPVFRLGPGSHTCVRFNRHAVYLGRPGAQQACPAHAAGRTESILVSPESGPAADLSGSAAQSSAGAPTGAAAARVVKPAQGVVVTATWRRHPGAVRGALGVASVLAAGRAYERRAAAAAARAARRRGALMQSVTPDAAPVSGAGGVTFPVGVTPAGSPGTPYTGLGFDACSTPSTTTMADWAASPFRAIGVYLGGTNMACSQANLTASWVSTESAAGWNLIPLYVGLQAPGNGCGCAAITPASAAAQGAAAAQDSIVHAEAIGLGPGNPIYFDMENYTRTATASDAVLSFLSGWTSQLHLSGYASGVYSSELSGVEDLVAEQGTGYAEPDDIWIANWNNEQSTADPKVPATDWADQQRLHQYRGGHTDDYGGASISIDSDYVDAATAAPGTGGLTTTIAAAPSVSVKPQADGTIDLFPSWSGQPGIRRWQISTGNSPTALTPAMTVRTSGGKPVVSRSAYGYFQVEALNAEGQPVGSSGTVPTPTHVAIFGQRAFVPRRGPGGLPVECFGITGCKVTATIRDATKRLVTTAPAKVAAGGGIVHFPLTVRAHKMLAAAGSHGVPATVTVHTTTGRVAKRAMTLVPFSVSGAGPARQPGTSPAMRLVGETEFVAGGWQGGVLVACTASTPCTATPSVATPAGVALATAGAQTIGSGEVGYLHFRMTSAGHAMLHQARARSNQVGARVTVTTGDGGLTGNTSVSALVSLDVF
jgi:hypothetical protein